MAPNNQSGLHYKTQALVECPGWVGEGRENAGEGPEGNLVCMWAPEWSLKGSRQAVGKEDLNTEAGKVM